MTKSRFTETPIVKILKEVEGGRLVKEVCREHGISDALYRYMPDPHRDEPVVQHLQEANERYPVHGFGKRFELLRRWGHAWNHTKRVHRVYCSLKLHKRRRGKKRLPAHHPQPLCVPATANQCWSMDFMSDGLYCGRRFRTFNAVDDFNRQALAIEIDISLPALRVIRCWKAGELTRVSIEAENGQWSGVHLDRSGPVGRIARCGA